MPIELKKISYTYAAGTPYEAKALNDVSLKIGKGEFTGIMGKTGCGKSTLIQLIAGLITPLCGQVIVDGEDINSRRYNRDKLRKKIGVVFQFPEIQLFETTVARDTAFGLRHFGWSGEKTEAAVRRALEIMGFAYEEVKDRSPLGFSGGEKRKLAIAGVLAAEPEVLILDEPVAGLDPMGREELLSLLDKLNGEGTTIIMVSHNAAALAEHAKRIIVIENGSVAADGETDEVFSKYSERKSEGVGVGDVRELVERLKECGIYLPDTTVRYDQLLSCLSLRLGGGKP